MATFTLPISVTLGEGNTGLGSALGYVIYGADGTEQIARTTTGITEDLNAAGGAGGSYSALPTVDTEWAPVRVVWNATGRGWTIAETYAAVPTADDNAAAVESALAAIGLTEAALARLLPTDPAACRLEGRLHDGDEPLNDISVTADLQDAPLASGSYLLGTRTRRATTGPDGYWYLDLTREASYRVRIPEAGVDVTVELPDAASVDLGTLLP